MQQKEMCSKERTEEGKLAAQPPILPGKSAAEAGALKELVAVTNAELLGKVVRKRRQYSQPGLGSAPKRRTPTARRAVPVPPVPSQALASGGTELIQLCDLIRLASVIPECEPLLETPKTIVRKAREYIVTLIAELERRKMLHRTQMELLRHEISKPNAGFSQQRVPDIVSWIKASQERAKP